MSEAPRLALIVRPNATGDGLQAALESMGYVVVKAHSFSAARKRLTKDLHLLITDLRLGAYNGLHLVLLATHDRPDLLAVVLADAADAVLQREAESMGATYIVRPEREEALIQSVLDFVRSRSGRSVPPRR